MLISSEKGDVWDEKMKRWHSIGERISKSRHTKYQRVRKIGEQNKSYTDQTPKWYYPLQLKMPSEFRVNLVSNLDSITSQTIKNKKTISHVHSVQNFSSYAPFPDSMFHQSNGTNWGKGKYITQQHTGTGNKKDEYFLG